MHTECQNQSGVTLVELLVVVAILGIIGAISGLFLLKYLPDYRLRSAVNELAQTARLTQSNALKGITPWYIEFSVATQSYAMYDSGADGSIGTADDILVKNTAFSNYDSGVKLGSGPTGEAIITGLSTSRAIYTVEGTVLSGGAVRLSNNKDTTYRITFLRTGSIRSSKWEGMWK